MHREPSLTFTTMQICRLHLRGPRFLHRSPRCLSEALLHLRLYWKHLFCKRNPTNIVSIVSMVNPTSIHPPLWRFGGWAFVLKRSQKAVGWCEGPRDCDYLHCWICACPHLHQLLLTRIRETWVEMIIVRTSTENACVEGLQLDKLDKLDNLA